LQCQVVTEQARKVKVRVPAEVWDPAAAASEKGAAVGPQAPDKDKARDKAEGKDAAGAVAEDKNEADVKTKISNPFSGKEPNDARWRSNGPRRNGPHDRTRGRLLRRVCGARFHEPRWWTWVLGLGAWRRPRMAKSVLRHRVDGLAARRLGMARIHHGRTAGSLACRTSVSTFCLSRAGNHPAQAAGRIRGECT